MAALDTLDYSSPFVALATLADDEVFVFFGAAEEVAAGVVGPHVDVVTHLASWHLCGGQTLRESLLHHLVERSADLSAGWWLWLYWHGVAVLDPVTILEPVPLTVMVLVGVALVVPVATVVGPALGEAVLGRSPVMPRAVVPLVPGLLFRVPLPDDLWLLVLLLAPLADGWVILVLLDEIHALLLGLEDLGVFCCDFLLGLAVMFLV